MTKCSSTVRGKMLSHFKVLMTVGTKGRFELEIGGVMSPEYHVDQHSIMILYDVYQKFLLMEFGES